MQSSLKTRYKIVLIGDSQVGKTSLIRRYVSGSFDERYLVTVGTAVSKRVEVVMLEGGRMVEVGLVLWDIEGGQGVPESLRETYLKSAKGGMAVFDVTRRETLSVLAGWVQTARRQEPRMPILVLGNKSDLEALRVVGEAEAQEYCRNLGCNYLPTSAKTGLNVEAAFWQLCRGVLRTYASL